MIQQLYTQALQAQQSGHLTAAESLYRRILELRPELAEVRLALGNVLLTQGREAEAAAAFERTLLDAGGAGSNTQLQGAAYCNLGVLCRNAGQFDRADTCLRQAVARLPGQALAWSNLADVCFQTGRVDEALAHVATAQRLDPHTPLYASNEIYYLQYHSSTDASRMRAALDRWSARFADPSRDAARPQGPDRTPERRLRIGYVSPDFRHHCQAHFMMPLLAHHDRTQVEVVCYSDVAVPDDITAQLRGRCGLWREIVGRSDDEVAALIGADAIDILVDLTMHMAGNRLQVFARKPAPVQVTWLAYPGSTGLQTIDYRLTDPYLDPPGCDESAYVEKTWRLPATFWCHDTLEPHPPEVTGLPARERGYVTFGCLNNFCKVNAATLELWARVLREIPTSRLLLLADAGAHCQRTTEVLENLGIARDRVRFEGRRAYRKYLELFQQIDMSLDTLPYNGHTTSLDSLFMGVPVVTLVGQTVVGRAGLSQLTNLGLTELIAHTPEEFVRIAVGLAHDTPRLAGIRGGLRQRMQQSPLMDAAGFARGIEAAFRRMWRTWCAGGGGEAR